MMKVYRYLATVFIGVFVFPFVGFAACAFPRSASIEQFLTSKNLAIGLYEKKIEDGHVVYNRYLGNEKSVPTLQYDGSFCTSEFSLLDKKDTGYILFLQIEGTSMRFLNTFEEKVDAVNRFIILSNVYETLQSDAYKGMRVRSIEFYRFPGETLRPGMKNDDVKKMQKALKVKLGLDSSFVLDGKYGPMTISMVKRFQSIIGIKQDGIAGEKTLSALVGVAVGTNEEENTLLENLYEKEESGNDLQTQQIIDSPKKNIVPFSLPSSTLRPGSNNIGGVKKLQEALKSVLNLGKDFKIDGKYGPMTTNAVIQIQRNLSLKDDGIFGPLTRDAFINEYGKVNSSQGNEGAVDNTNTNPTIQEGQSAQESENTGLDTEIKALLLHAKNELLNFKTERNSFSDILAYERVIRYNNDILRTSPNSDPLYISLDGGSNFVYTAKLPNGKYACVDGDKNKTLVEQEERASGQEITGC